MRKRGLTVVPIAAPDVGFEEGAIVTMTPADGGFRTIYFGFGFEGVTSEAERTALMGATMDYLLS